MTRMAKEMTVVLQNLSDLSLRVVVPILMFVNYSFRLFSIGLDFFIVIATNIDIQKGLFD